MESGQWKFRVAADNQPSAPFPLSGWVLPPGTICSSHIACHVTYNLLGSYYGSRTWHPVRNTDPPDTRALGHGHRWCRSEMRRMK